MLKGRVDHLLIDPDHDFSPVAGMVPSRIGGPSNMLGERAVETASATSARVTSVSIEASAPLRDADGMAALLRY